MSCVIHLKPHNLGVRSKQDEFAPDDTDESTRVTHNVASLHSNHRIGRVVYSAIMVIATSGCYGQVGVDEPRHPHRNEAYHEDHHEQPANEHREEHHDREHHDDEHLN